MGKENPYSPERDLSNSPESWFSEKTNYLSATLDKEECYI